MRNEFEFLMNENLRKILRSAKGRIGNQREWKGSKLGIDGKVMGEEGIGL